jgi:hypothetical protein
MRVRISGKFLAEIGVNFAGAKVLKYLHLDGTLGAKVCPEDLLEALSGVDVDAEGGSFADDVSLGVDELE